MTQTTVAATRPARAFLTTGPVWLAGAAAAALSVPSAAALVAVSLAFPLAAAHTATSTRLTLAGAHLLAAAIIIPVIARRLAHPR